MHSDAGEAPLPLATPFTLVIWTGCLAIGLGGYWLQTPPLAPARVQFPVQAVMLNVEIATSTLLPPMSAIPPAPVAVPLTQTRSPPALARLTALNPIFAQRRPATVPIRQVAVQPRAHPATQPAPVVQQLTLGQGEGRQPSPEYPREAQIDGEEGVIVVRFSVNPDGSVLNVQAVSPCRWPLLNQSAVRTVRELWRFSPGSPRLYEIRFSFVINRQ